jgi:hypothetical protein
MDQCIGRVGMGTALQLFPSLGPARLNCRLYPAISTEAGLCWHEHTICGFLCLFVRYDSSFWAVAFHGIS